MLTEPLEGMRTILIAKMPQDSVFVGDDLYKKELETIEKNPQTLLSTWELKDKKNLTLSIQKKYEPYRDSIKFLKTNPPRIIRTNKKDSSEAIELSIQNHDKSTFVTFDQSTNVYQWMFTEPSRDAGLLLPYVLIDLDALATVKKLESEKK
jgi:hypothetical protein